ncbi:MAG TPA: restriction endonuclease subunit R [Lentisphaeria bacterium]|nr:MAG: restriction endonuclease subunit R [Lentisphaerae bacterium GWF2_49_21]HBC86756.1 restriction endonuclease subunit R [Lentisphaeria bacterium]
MPAPQEILKLVERFETNRESYMSGEYKEAQIRIEFLDPFFEQLGWDMGNKNGYAEAYKDVIHEDSIKIGSATEAPDYCFRIGGTRKFFLEAKKPSVFIKEAVPPAYQLRRYAWSSKLPLSILTDFEEFAVYDCRIRPNKNDAPALGRVKYFTYKDYPQIWDEIYSVFSREAILKGSFDKYAETAKGKKGTASVDASFLEEIENWRANLAKNIAVRNSQLSQRELNFAVQKTIDRLIFLRICEDRGIEHYGRLGALQNGVNIYERLVQYFREADSRYNSGLFHFNEEKERPEGLDALTPGIKIDDKIFKEIIGTLYYPECPFEFSVLPADILGQVYEQFLGKVIRLTEGHQAKVEEKPEVRKAGGVYYTPTYIVDYIVDNTLGKLLETYSIGKSSPLRVLDPACGSGSFLIVAYQRLLDWYLKQYNQNPEKYSKGKNPRIRRGSTGDWKLTINERKRILLEHIYGVDIDSQAVEVTKLSLLLKVLEGENEETMQGQLFHERALPDLGQNIKCGNSLIGSDFYKDRQSDLFNEEEMIRVNAFDWESQFPEIFNVGVQALACSSREGKDKPKFVLQQKDNEADIRGFDAVIGNPPYVRQETLGEQFKTYAQTHYKTFAGTADLYTYFIEKGVSLLREGGYFSYIVANKWMRANYGKPLRTWLKQQCIEEITDFGDLPVFENATTYPCIIRIKRAKPNSEFNVANIASLDFSNLNNFVKEVSFPLKKSSLDDTAWTLVNQESQNLLEKLRKAGIPLGEYAKGEIYRGVLTGLNEAFVIDCETRNRLISEDAKSAEIIKPFLAGRDIKRYETPEADRYLIFTRRGMDINKYPAILKHLEIYRENLTPKPNGFKGTGWQGRKPGKYKWYEIQDAVDYYSEFEKPKIIYPNILKRPEFLFDNSSLYTNQKCFIIPCDDKFLLGILNSQVTFSLFKMILPKLRGGFYEPSYVFFKDFPIAKTKPQLSERLIALVAKMIELHKKLSEAKVPETKTMLQRQIDATDKEIDKLVYALYGLTEDEIKIVEGV